MKQLCRFLNMQCCLEIFIKSRLQKSYFCWQHCKGLCISHIYPIAWRENANNFARESPSINFTFYSSLRPCRVQLMRADAFTIPGQMPHEWKTVSHIHSANIYFLDIDKVLAFSAIYEELRQPANAKKLDIIVSFAVFWNTKLLFTRLWRAWLPDGLLWSSYVNAMPSQSVSFFFLVKFVFLDSHRPPTVSSTVFTYTTWISGVLGHVKMF